jgi:peptidyl-prolyl cis-trans isomerase A (cyclophilin A)
VRRLLYCATLAAFCACGGNDSNPVIDVATMPDTFRVEFQTTRGRFVVEAYRAWAPLGTEQFYRLIPQHAFDDNGFFRVVPKYIVQFGAPGDTKLNARLDSSIIKDDPRTQKNLRGTIAFAMSGPDTRSHQMFINYSDNANLDRQNFVPVGRVVEGMDVVDSIYAEYRQKPDFHMIATLGNNYLYRMFPRIDYIRKAQILR